MLTETYSELPPEYICEVGHRDGRDEMVVRIETTGPLDAPVAAYETLLRARPGVEIAVRLAVPGELAAPTQIEVRRKPIRLIDGRKG